MADVLLIILAALAALALAALALAVLEGDAGDPEPPTLEPLAPLELEPPRAPVDQAPGEVLAEAVAGPAPADLGDVHVPWLDDGPTLEPLEVGPPGDDAAPLDLSAESTQSAESKGSRPPRRWRGGVVRALEVGLDMLVGAAVALLAVVLSGAC